MLFSWSTRLTFLNASKPVNCKLKHFLLTFSERLGQEAAGFKFSIISPIHEVVPLTACNQWKCSCLAQAGGGPQRIKSPFLQHCLVTCMKSLGGFGHFKFGKGPKHNNSIQQSPVLSVCLFALLKRNQNCHHGCHPIAFSSVLTGEVKDCLRHEKMSNFVRCNLSKIQLQNFRRMG